jgi:hypothetical protein
VTEMMRCYDDLRKQALSWWKGKQVVPGLAREILPDCCPLECCPLECWNSTMCCPLECCSWAGRWHFKWWVRRGVIWGF